MGQNIIKRYKYLHNHIHVFIGGRAKKTRKILFRKDAV